MRDGGVSQLRMCFFPFLVDSFCSTERRLIDSRSLLSRRGRPELAGIVGDDASAWLNGPLQFVESRSKTWFEGTKGNPEYTTMILAQKITTGFLKKT